VARTGGTRSLRSVPLARVPGGPVAGTFDVQSYPVPDGGLLVLFSEVSTRERQARELAERSAENERPARARPHHGGGGRLGRGARRPVRGRDHAVRRGGRDGGEVLDDEARFIAVANHPPAVRGHRFPLAGTLTGRLLALEQQAPAAGPAVLLRADASGAEDAAFCGDLADGRRVGDLLLAPLAAHGEMLGVLAVSRAEGDAPFAAVDEERLRVVADHASLALYKAGLVEEAQAANSTKSAFLATVSHELRTPLTALTGYGELLADEIAGPLTAGQADIVERMRTVTHQLTGMIEEVLTFSALEAGREVVRPAPVDVAEVVQAVVAVVEPLAEQKRLAFRAAVPPVAPALVTDPDKLRQILVNLCGNAVKFTGAGSVSLAVEATDHDVRCHVRDTGVGIDRPTSAASSTRSRSSTRGSRGGTAAPGSASTSPSGSPGCWADASTSRPCRASGRRSRSRSRCARRPAPAGRTPGPRPGRTAPLPFGHDCDSHHQRVQRRVHRGGVRGVPARPGLGRRVVAAALRDGRAARAPDRRGAAAGAPAGAAAPDPELLRKTAAAAALVHGIRDYGHLAVRIDPLGADPPGASELTPEFYGVTEADLAAVPAEALGFGDGRFGTAADVVALLRRRYSNTLGIEYTHLSSDEERAWFRATLRAEQVTKALTAEEKRACSRASPRWTGWSGSWASRTRGRSASASRGATPSCRCSTRRSPGPPRSARARW
jgi:signal transduction histidine kinase